MFHKYFQNNDLHCRYFRIRVDKRVVSLSGKAFEKYRELSKKLSSQEFHSELDSHFERYCTLAELLG
jgi:hypothetical protein